MGVIGNEPGGEKRWLNYKDLPFFISPLLWNVDIKDNSPHFPSGMRDGDGKWKKLKIILHAKKYR